MKLFDLFKRKPLYEYGHVSDTPARRNRTTGEVQFVLWKAGEQGHQQDYWHKFGDGWEKQFVPDLREKNGGGK